MKRNEINS